MVEKTIDCINVSCDIQDNFRPRPYFLVSKRQYEDLLSISPELHDNKDIIVLERPSKYRIELDRLIEAKYGK